MQGASLESPISARRYHVIADTESAHNCPQLAARSFLLARSRCSPPPQVFLCQHLPSFRSPFEVEIRNAMQYREHSYSFVLSSPKSLDNTFIKKKLFVKSFPMIINDTVTYCVYLPLVLLIFYYFYNFSLTFMQKIKCRSFIVL